jgi:hypothetical protein
MLRTLQSGIETLVPCPGASCPINEPPKSSPLRRKTFIGSDWLLNTAKAPRIGIAESA